MKLSIQEASFEKIALKHMDTLYSRAIRLTRDTPKAEELIQITYFQAFKYFPKISGSINFKNWLLNILDEIYNKRFTTGVEIRTDMRQTVSSLMTAT